jgi:cholinesterase
VSEDCLFLDVHVPAHIYDKAEEASKGKGKDCHKKGGAFLPQGLRVEWRTLTYLSAAVMVWIYGGGYTTGQKDSDAYSPTGLIARSQLDGQEGIILIALNYRLGLFGWLNAPGEESILANAGLWDQRLGLEWVRRNVHLFGGDPKRVTVIGESAGAGSIFHHITAFGGEKGRAPFAAAIPQSPAFSTTPNNAETWAKVLAAASQLSGVNVTTAAQLKGLPSSVLLQVNQAVTYSSFDGGFSFGPSVDGGFVPELPGVLMLKGKYDKSVKVMAGHNLNESATFVPAIATAQQLSDNLNVVFTGASPATKDYILNVLYPDVLDGTYGYTTEFSRAVQLTSDASFSCNARYLANGFCQETYAYRFEVPPGYHGQDIPYTFFEGNEDGSGSNTTTGPIPGIAVAMQRFFTTFAMTGSPNGVGTASSGLLKWPVYGTNATLVTFGLGGVGTARDDTANFRCEYWQSGVYLSP